MATLFEIDKQIMDCINFETGEVLDFSKLEALQIARDEKCENIALWIKNLLSDAEQIKAEKERMAQREQRARNKAKQLQDYLTYALDGVKFNTPKVAVSFRSSEKVAFTDETKFVEAMQVNGRDDLLSYSAPTPNKTAIKSALKNGEEIEGAYILKTQNIQIK